MKEPKSRRSPDPRLSAWIVVVMAYHVPDYRIESKKIARLFRFHPPSLIVGVLLVVVGVIYKKMFSPIREGFPEYFTFLVLVAFVPAVSFFPTARRFINWRAFSVSKVGDRRLSPEHKARSSN